jgi:hypothetical protein
LKNAVACFTLLRMFQFTNRQAVVFCIVILFAAALIIWGLNHAVNWWIPPPALRPLVSLNLPAVLVAGRSGPTHERVKRQRRPAVELASLKIILGRAPATTA